VANTNPRSSGNEAIGVASAEDTGAVHPPAWKWSALAGMASYLDAGSIVALSAGLALFRAQFGLSDGAVGVLAAIGPNASVVPSAHSSRMAR